MTSGRKTRGRPISIALAMVDDDYYAEIRARLRSKGEALRAFERAVDEAWRNRPQPPPRRATVAGGACPP